MIKQTGEFLAPKTLRDRFGGVNAMKKVLGVIEGSPASEKFFKTATKPKTESIFILKHAKHHEILILIFENFYGSMKPYKPYRVSL